MSYASVVGILYTKRLPNIITNLQQKGLKLATVKYRRSNEVHKRDYKFHMFRMNDAVQLRVKFGKFCQLSLNSTHQTCFLSHLILPVLVLSPPLLLSKTEHGFTHTHSNLQLCYSETLRLVFWTHQKILLSVE